MPNKTKKQHYVPRFYLKNFSNKNKDEFFIHCYDIDKKDSYPANIKNIGEEKDFYKIADENYEEFFQKTEEWASPIINNLSKNGKIKSLNIVKNREKLSLFLAIQFLRTKEMREDLLEIFSKISMHLQKHNLSKEMELLVEEIDEKNIKHNQMGFIGHGALKMIDELLSKKWVVLKNKTEIDFLTSDNPVVLYNPHGFLGVASKYIHIFYPINPKLCLCLLDPLNYSNFGEYKKFEGNEISMNIRKTEKYQINSIDDVNMINDVQSKNATKHIFSKHNSFDRVSCLVEKGLIVPSEKRERVKFQVFKNTENGNDIIVTSNPNNRVNFI